ncbi:MAG: 1,6-anhydro-N-acetylmuramyl-L-alanine amidase AmpD [Gammaproteobacteria bacterium]|nr:1,6-anhydro-N-acetylmuramyl-L-alanine amidase AmpD [Gammaproteobacteria bacterium]
MKINTDTGRLYNATQVASPNYDDRPDPSDIDLIVVHNISLPPGQFGGPWIDALFTNSLDPLTHPYFAEIHQLQVSAHTLIRRDGEIVQYVPFHKRAWHAGKSQYKNRERCNDFSIGIELEGSDEQDYESPQYTQLAQLITILCTAYPKLSTQRLAGHCDIAQGRKTDPGPAFDWARLYKLLSKTP